VPLVHHFARQIVAAGGPLSLEDAIGEGFIGLTRAARNFREGHGASFSTFASIAIKGAILDALRRATPLSRSGHRSTQRFLSEADRLHNELGREATLGEIAESMGVTPERAAEIKSKTKLQVLSLEGHYFDENKTLDLAADDDTEKRVMDYCTARELRDFVDQLPKRERIIIKRRFFQDRSLRQIGQELGVSESRVSQIHARALRLLRQMMRDNGELFEAA
jgi:RNA polymerase sigma factor for flagellar operon FliA